MWIYFDTYYQLGPEDLFYKSGFLKGRIKIMDIREIVPGKTRHVGLKPALARQGLIVKYNRFDEIYLAPEHNEELIADLRQINDSIVIKK
ncbi:hypothetical protein HNQ92_005812 [Rhabdobacter roseus]|uniref:Uncharacterized protein YyaB-like PH domain-containing protein n=1 Tax=Rhabdobacter roseus TaxID=1655419 RepID=A0A840TXI7_9BACT|nr:hypothetical protein [Rhabdobacter roseus]